MSDDQVFIVSDLHLGSEFFHRELFLQWFHGRGARAKDPGTSGSWRGGLRFRAFHPLKTRS